MIVKIFDGELVIDKSNVDEPENEIRKQIEEFLNGGRKSFDLNFSFPGSSTGYILRKINEIPYGETRTYGEIADEISTSALAVGQACSKNPLPLIIPCHRVVGKNSTGGYQAGEDVKRKLLRIES